MSAPLAPTSGLCVARRRGSNTLDELRGVVAPRNGGVSSTSRLADSSRRSIDTSQSTAICSLTSTRDCEPLVDDAPVRRVLTNGNN